MQEIELKFQIPAEQLGRVSSFFDDASTTAIRLEARYFDTSGHDLARQGIALRLRQENGQWVQRLKAAGAPDVARWEHNVAAGAPSFVGH